MRTRTESTFVVAVTTILIGWSGTKAATTPVAWPTAPQPMWATFPDGPGDGGDTEADASIPDGPDRILEALNALSFPHYDPSRRDEAGYREGYVARYRQAVERQAELAWALYQAAPGHPRLPELLRKRWQWLSDPRTIHREIDQVLAGRPDSPLVEAALRGKVELFLEPGYGTDEEARTVIETYTRSSARGDASAAGLYLSLADHRLSEPKDRAAIYRLVLDRYPETSAAVQARGRLRQVEAIGQPFQLEFQDAISGRTVSIEDFRNKVVVVHFWASWCGPCVSEMDGLRAIARRYQDRGVQFIGVSLDDPEADGGRQALEGFIAEHEIGWPQYYQGNGWESTFSRAWGVTAIPAIFVVDPDGKLHTTDARGNLDTILDDLLDRRSAERMD